MLFEKFLRQPIIPFVNELLLSRSPKEIEALRNNYAQFISGPEVINVAQQLNNKFFNPLEIVWFDPNVHNIEN
jgi:hypothetical protein